MQSVETAAVASSEPAARYARLGERLNALTIDGLVAFLCFMAVLELIGPSLLTPALLIAPLFFEPIWLRLFSRTPGQAVFGLQVVPMPPRTRNGLPRLFARYLVKLLLGLPDTVYAMYSGRAQALHDRLFDTAVVRGYRGSVPPAPRPDPSLPGAWRRLTVSLVWCVIAFVGFVFALGLLLEATDQLEPEPILDLVLGVAFSVVLVVVFELGADGRLPGARRRRASAPA